MDQSGPRPRLGDNDQEAPPLVMQKPLIIERPDLAHPVRRMLALSLTVGAWCGLVAMWIPVFGALAVSLGVPLTRGIYPSAEGVVALRGLLEVFPAAVGLVLIVLAVNGLLSWVLRRFAAPPVHRFVGMEQLATGVALDPKQLAEWQSGRILHVEHGPLGRVIGARIVR